MKKRLTYLKEYVTDCQTALGLVDWDIEVKDEEPSEGLVAEISIVDGQRRGTIKFGKLFWAETRSAKVNAVGHELGHCKTRDVFDAAYGQLHDLLGEGAMFKTAIRVVKEQEELLVDSLATIFEAVLPPWEGP